MRDFTLEMYSILCNKLDLAGYQFQTVESFIEKPSPRAVIIRHDVDSWPANALHMARIEAEHNIKATYYFRKSRLSFNRRIILSIVSYGHEIGYHYEDLANSNGKLDAAMKTFTKNLEFFRGYYPVKSIAMHGKPLSRWDSKDLWKYCNYRKFGLIAEPYLDIDFTKVMYLTDTGNCWDGNRYSIRDHVKSHYNHEMHSTTDVLNNIEQGKMPDQIMLNVHPARWNNNPIKWFVRYYLLTLPKYQAKIWLKLFREKQKI